MFESGKCTHTKSCCAGTRKLDYAGGDSLLVLASQSWLDDCFSVVSAELSVCVGGQVSLPSSIAEIL